MTLDRRASVIARGQTANPQSHFWMTSLNDAYIWRFTPVAAAHDPWWQGRPVWLDFRVVAATAGAAIVAAARHDEVVRGFDPIVDAQDRQGRRSGFVDPRLYRCDRLAWVDAREAPPGSLVLARLV
jgi:hypothetical protein